MATSGGGLLQLEMRQAGTADGADIIEAAMTRLLGAQLELQQAGQQSAGAGRMCEARGGSMECSRDYEQGRRFHQPHTSLLRYKQNDTSTGAVNLRTCTSRIFSFSQLHSQRRKTACASSASCRQGGSELLL